MTAVPIQLARCIRYLAKADHGEGCVFLSNIAPALCTCGLEDLRKLVTSMKEGKPEAVSVQLEVPNKFKATCNVPGCGLKDVAHIHVPIGKP